MVQRRKRKTKTSGKEREDMELKKEITSIPRSENKEFYDQYLAPPTRSYTENSQMDDSFQKFISAGGQKCISFFQSLFNNWRHTGALPSLSEDEAIMLNQMYQLWLDNQSQQNTSPKPVKSTESKKDATPVKPTAGNSSNAKDSEKSNLGTNTVTLAQLKEMVSVHNNETLTTLVSQMEILVKAPEPTCTHAQELVDMLSSPEYIQRNTYILDRLADEGETCYTLAMAIFHDRNPSDRSESSNKRSVKLYLQAANRDNSIAAMLLGAKYLRGDGVRADNVLALHWYTKAAALENPIAQHKLGYFYDEGLEGACEINIPEAVRCYSRASELMPDSMHNLAKIYEDGRGELHTDMKQAVTLYSVAAARGFPLSQVNLGRLFLLGEDGVKRDREAGKRLLTLAAESGDCDAQMVVGMIYATAAFECCNLPLAEYWLRQSLQGGKADAEKLLVRVCQQMQMANLQSISEAKGGVPRVSQDSQAAVLRGNDFLVHGLVHAAILEFTRAFVLDRTQLSPLVDRLEAITMIGHHDDCLSDCLELLTSHASAPPDPPRPRGNSTATAPPKQGQGQPSASHTAISDSQSASPPLSGHLLERVYAVLAGNIAELYGVSPSYPNMRLAHSNSSGTGGNGNGNGNGVNLYASSTTATYSYPGSPNAPISFNLLKDVAVNHRGPVLNHLLYSISNFILRNGPFATTIVPAAKAVAFLLRLSAQGRAQCRVLLAHGCIPIVLNLLHYTQNNADATSAIANSKGTLNSPNVLTINPYVLPIWCDATGLIVNMTKFLHLLNLITVCEGVPVLVRLAKRAIPCARVASAAIQALGNLAVLAEDTKTWSHLLGGGLLDAFISTLSLPLTDLVDLPPSAKAAEAKVKGDGARWMERKDRLELLVVAVLTLGRIMQVARGVQAMHNGPGPGDLARGLASAGTVATLQSLFRSNLLPSGLKTTAGFVLYKILCALDPGAPQLLKDSETRNEVREQLHIHQSGLSKGKSAQQSGEAERPGNGLSSSSSIVNQMFSRISKSLSGSQADASASEKDSTGEPLTLNRQQREALLVGYSLDVSRVTSEYSLGTLGSPAGMSEHPPPPPVPAGPTAAPPAPIPPPAQSLGGSSASVGANKTAKPGVQSQTKPGGAPSQPSKSDKKNASSMPVGSGGNMVGSVSGAVRRGSASGTPAIAVSKGGGASGVQSNNDGGSGPSDGRQATGTKGKTPR